MKTTYLYFANREQKFRLFVMRINKNVIKFYDSKLNRILVKSDEANITILR